MATYTENGITFTTVTRPSISTGGRISTASYTTDQGGNITALPTPVANCIDVDLCGADMGNNTTLSTFSDLISYILALEARIQALENNT